MNQKLLTTFAILPLVGGMIPYYSSARTRTPQITDAGTAPPQEVRFSPAESARRYAKHLILQDIRLRNVARTPPRSFPNTASRIGAVTQAGHTLWRLPSTGSKPARRGR